MPGGAFAIIGVAVRAHRLDREPAADARDKAVRERVPKRSDTTEGAASFERER